MTDMVIRAIQVTAIALMVFAVFVNSVTEPKARPVPGTGMRVFGFVASLVILAALIAGW